MRPPSGSRPSVSDGKGILGGRGLIVPPSNCIRAQCLPTDSNTPSCHAHQLFTPCTLTPTRARLITDLRRTPRWSLGTRLKMLCQMPTDGRLYDAHKMHDALPLSDVRWTRAKRGDAFAAWLAGTSLAPARNQSSAGSAGREDTAKPHVHIRRLRRPHRPPQASMHAWLANSAMLIHNGNTSSTEFRRFAQI